jgi:hypothetical protein
LIAGVGRGEISEVELHAFDEIDWTRWYDRPKVTYDRVRVRRSGGRRKCVGIPQIA